MENDHADHIHANAPDYCPLILTNTCLCVIILVILDDKNVWKYSLYIGVGVIDLISKF